MAKKKAKIITGLGRDPVNKLIVQKSHTLAALWQSNLSLPEFKILDMYLARIDSSVAGQRTVQITKGELERALGVARINQDDLETRLTNLFVPINLATKKGEIKLRSLFEAADAKKDEDGLWQVELRCTEDAAKYIFNIERIGYFRYKLRSVVGLTSRYSYLLFNYLEENRFRGTWEVELKELKKVLKCDKEETYKEYKRFNDLILKKCQKELFEKTECHFEYEAIRRGRSVALLRFGLEPLSPQITAEMSRIQDPDQTMIIDDEANYERYKKREAICSGFGEKIFDEFSDEELIEFRKLAWGKEDPDEVDRKDSVLHDRRIAVETAVSGLIHEKILAMNAYSQRDPVNNRYTYLKASLVNYIPKSKAKGSSQSSFDIDEFFAAALEKSYGKE